MDAKTFPTQCAYFTHRGLRRSVNEDAILVNNCVWQEDFNDIRIATIAHTQPSLFAVADGLGRHGNGAVASRLVLESLQRVVPTIPGSLSIEQSLLRVNEDIYKEILRQEKVTPMGSTVAGVVVSDRNIAVFNVGDSRVYKISNEVRLLSQDDRGRSRDWVTQCLGGASEFETIAPHIVIVALEPPMCIVLCTDGVSDFVTDADWESIRGKPSVGIAQAIRDRAFGDGALDNLSLIVIQFDD